jgi:hypothetical protein
VQALLQEHAGAAAALQRELSLARALLAPDPPPARRRLWTSVEACCAFLTEGASLPPPAAADLGGGGAGGGGAPREFAEPLGLGPHVPRFLRRDAQAGPVALERMGRVEAEAAVADVWRARAAGLGGGVVGADDGCGGASAGAAASLQGFLFDHLMAQHSGDAVAAVAAGYSLYHALTEHAGGGSWRDDGCGRVEGGNGKVDAAATGLFCGSAAVAMFLAVLSGELPEAAAWEQRRLLRAAGRAAAALRAASAASAARGGVANSWAGEQRGSGAAVPGGEGGAPAGGTCSTDDLLAALRFLLPFKTQDRWGALATCAQQLAPQAAAEAAAAGVDGGGGGGAASAAAWDLGAIEAAAEEMQRPRAKLPLAVPGVPPHPAAASDAARELLNALLLQQLEELQVHAAAALERLRGALLEAQAAAPRAGAPSSAGSSSAGVVGASSGEALLQGVVEALAYGPDGGSDDGAAGGGRATGGGGAAGPGGSLLAAAAAKRLQRSAASGAGGWAAMAPPPWLAGALDGLADGAAGAPSVGPLIAALRASTLLLPRSCMLDEAGLLQWTGLARPAGPAARGGMSAAPRTAEVLLLRPLQPAAAEAAAAAAKDTTPA